MNHAFSKDSPPNRRVLVVDDNPTIHEDYLKILGRRESSAAGVDAEALDLFENVKPVTLETGFEVEVAHQGQEALALVRQARDCGRPYAMAFVDMRMPPGWDGLTTITHLWQADPELQTVICTAYSDRSWEEIQATLTSRERWLVVKKPFDKIEILQLAHALTEKWNLARLAALKVETLEQLVRARTEDLKRAQRVQSEFLANASHELLTPLNAVAGFLELLSMTTLDGEQQDYLQESKGGAQRLKRLILRMLDFNRAAAGTIAVEHVAFRPDELLQSAICEHGAAANAKRLPIWIATSVTASQSWRGPKAVIGQVLGLLLDNAIKFTSVGEVILRVETTPAGLEFSITDTGVGLTPQQVEWLRTPFAQVDGGTTRRGSGFGLGVPLARNLVRAAGGDLSLRAAPDRGTVATFSVRASPMSPPAL